MQNDIRDIIYNKIVYDTSIITNIPSYNIFKLFRFFNKHILVSHHLLDMDGTKFLKLERGEEHNFTINLQIPKVTGYSFFLIRIYSLKSF